MFRNLWNNEFIAMVIESTTHSLRMFGYVSFSVESKQLFEPRSHLRWLCIDRGRGGL